jgi:hypothetical protein
MARVVIPLQDQLNHAITKASFTAGDATNGMSFQNNGFVKLIVKAGATAAATITIKSVTDSNRRTGNIVFTVAANEIWESSFFESMLFNSGGSVEIDMTSATDLSFAAIRQKV